MLPKYFYKCLARRNRGIYIKNIFIFLTSSPVYVRNSKYIFTYAKQYSVNVNTHGTTDPVTDFRTQHEKLHAK